jgi:hypothetical protein
MPPCSRLSRALAPWLQTAGMVGVLLLVASIPALAVRQTWTSQQALRAAWNIAGPPCPPLTPAGSLSAWFPREFTYEGVSFERRFGHVMCVAPPKTGFINPEVYSVCQFTGPDTIRVTTAGKAVAFKPGVGQPATVTVRGGRVSCVLGGWFRL